MSNQRRASISTSASTSAIPRSIPTPPEQAIADESEPPTASFDAATLATNSHDGASAASPPTPTSLNGDNGAVSQQSTPSYKGLAPPTLNSLPHVSLGPAAHPSSHPSSLASALRALNEYPNGGAAFREFPAPPSNESPYTKSLSSTAPGSPRM